MSVENTILSNDGLQGSPEAFYSPKYDFLELVKKPRITNYESILNKGFEYLWSQASKYDLTILQSLFSFNQGKEDLSSKVQSYLVSNFDFKYNRHTDQKDDRLVELKVSDITKHEAHLIRQLISVFETDRGVLSKESSDHIEEVSFLQDYIKRHKSTTSLNELYELMPDIKQERIKDIYNGNNEFSKRGEQIKIMQAKLYFLSYDHEYFTYKKKDKTDPRTYTALTVLNKVYRKNEFCFQIHEFDIKSANPQIIDEMFGFNRFRTVYSNLMQAYNIDKEEAKKKFNATLNNHRLSRSQAEKIYKKAGYTAYEARQISAITSNVEKGSFYRYMAGKETQIIRDSIGSTFDNNKVLTIHDNILYDPELQGIKDSNISSYEFSEELTNKANLSLDLKVNNRRVVLAAPQMRHFTNKQYFDKSKAKIDYKAKHFTFFDKNFKVLTANFNINSPVYKKDGSQRTLTEIEFLERIGQLYKILLYLNGKKRVNGVFCQCIEAIAAQEGISFNKAYIYTIMKNWNFEPNDALEYVKIRNWTYHGGKLSRYRFQSLYYKELARAKQHKENQELQKDILKLKEALKKNQLYCISKAKYKRSNSTNTRQLITKIYSVIGIKLPKKIDHFNKVVESFSDPIESIPIGSAKNYTSDREMARYLNINRDFYRAIKYVLDNKAYIIYQLEKAHVNLNDLPEAENLFVEPAAAPEIKEGKSKVAFKNMPNREALTEWNKLDTYTKNFYQKNYAHGFLKWKEDYFDK